METAKDCPHCSWPLHEVWKVGDTPVDDLMLRGWYCPHCLHFDKATGRERRFTRDRHGNPHRLNGK